MKAVMFQPLDTTNPSCQAESVEEVVTVLYRDLSVRDRTVMANLPEALAPALLKRFVARRYGLQDKRQNVFGDDAIAGAVGMNGVGLVQ